MYQQPGASPQGGIRHTLDRIGWDRPQNLSGGFNISCLGWSLVRSFWNLVSIGTLGGIEY